jgi:hypothetical protein
MSAIRNDKKFASPVKKEGKAIGAELGEEELKQVVGGFFASEHGLNTVTGGVADLPITKSLDSVSHKL